MPPARSASPIASDQRQNILGGAKYLAQVIATIPKRIAEPDRTWLALAAYNVGYGHLEDARVLAQMSRQEPGLVGATCASSCRCWPRKQWYSRAQARLRARLGAGAIRASRCASTSRCSSGSMRQRGSRHRLRDASTAMLAPEAIRRTTPVEH